MSKSRTSPNTLYLGDEVTIEKRMQFSVQRHTGRIIAWYDGGRRFCLASTKNAAGVHRDVMADRSMIV